MRHGYLNLVILAFGLIAEHTSVAQTPMVPWVTRSMDNARSGWNPHETALTQASVMSRGIVQVTTIPVRGDARGMEAQPLILPNVKISNVTRDVMVLPSMADVIRGVDARDGSAIWETSVGTAVTGSANIDSHLINQHWGCLSTGVMDPETGRLYQVCWVSPDSTGNPQTARYFMFVLNVTDGSKVVPPVLIQGKSGTQDFNAAMRKQRSSLVEATVDGAKTVFGCSGTILETGAGASGYCFAFDVASNSVTAMLATTSGAGAGIWMAGQGAAADSQGNLYVLTGNGEFDGVSQWGESFLKLRYTPPAGGHAAGLRVVDHWTPWTDLARSGQTATAATRLAGMSMASEAIKPVGSGMSMPLENATLLAKVNDQGTPTVLVFPKMATGAWSDEDWGSAGPACIFSIGICVATGKDGIAYSIKTTSLGGTSLADLANPTVNCAKLAAPPVWMTMSPGPVDPCPKNPQTLNFFPWGDTAHLHMTPVQFFDPVLHSWTLFAWGENAQLHKWAVSSAGHLTYVAQGHEYASADVRETPPGGMPGGFCSGSSNGADPDSALLVCTIPYGDANAQVVNGRLLVYDPVHLAADGSLKVLWDSQRWNIKFLFNKFDPPVIDGGQIYVANYNGGVDVYRLTPIASAAAFQAKSASSSAQDQHLEPATGGSMTSIILAGLGLSVTFLLLLWLAITSDIVRDSNPVNLTPPQRRPYSLARCQMAFWFFLTLASYVFIFATTGNYNGIITQQSLILLGISSATGLSGAAIDNNKSATIVTWPVHTSFLVDLLTDVNGMTLHRFQMFIWTIVLGVIYVVSVVQTHKLPAFDEYLLTLMGISSGVYVGFKIPEKQQ